MTVEAVQPLLTETDTAKPRPKPTAAAGDTQRRTRFGIKAKLFLAFCSLAGLTTVASLVAWYVFGEIDHAVTRVTVESVPGTIAALSLAENGNGRHCPCTHGKRQSGGASSATRKFGGEGART